MLYSYLVFKKCIQEKIIGLAVQKCNPFGWKGGFMLLKDMVVDNTFIVHGMIQDGIATLYRITNDERKSTLYFDGEIVDAIHAVEKKNGRDVFFPSFLDVIEIM